MAIKTNDPLLSQQWHLNRIGLDLVFNDYRGKGVNVAVYDNGVQTDHADLSRNYDSSRQISVNGVQGSSAGGNHGTAVAGVIAASANDGIGGIGVASDAMLTGVNVFTGSASGTGMISAIEQMARFDVVNNSWGWTSRYADGAGTAFGSSFIAALESAVVGGRGGLGTVIVNSAGNDWQKGRVDANSSEFDSSRATITVGAVNDADMVSAYSTRGASVLVSAPSNGGSKGIVTTDLTGSGGYSSGDYTSTFGGTSAAAPIVSGVAALMLDANAQLGWRDVQSILALSAEHVGSAVGASPLGNEAFGWSYNHALTFNGGGMHFSNDYGFGLVDAHAAVRMAEVWSYFGKSQTSANEVSASVSLPAGKALTDGGTTSFSATLSGNVDIEHVDLTLNMTHGDVNQLRIEVISANGTVSEVLTPGTGAKQSQLGWTWTFGSEAFRGESAEGVWTVRITDTVTGSTGMVQSATLKAYGQARDANDVYHYTDAFAGMSGNAERTTLSDANGGMDWINAAATRAGALIDLEAGHASRVAGASLTIAAGSIIENAAGGDGADVLIGNAAGNTLWGGRGADLFAFAGLHFGQDKILDFSKGVDKIVFSAHELSMANLAITETADGSLVQFGNESSILLSRVSGLSANDFLFAVELTGLAPQPAHDWV